MKLEKFNKCKNNNQCYLEEINGMCLTSWMSNEASNFGTKAELK